MERLEVLAVKKLPVKAVEEVEILRGLTLGLNTWGRVGTCTRKLEAVFSGLLSYCPSI